MAHRTRVFLATIVLLTIVSWAHAEPYLAVREGLSCGSCHVNRTGGGQRTKMGAGYGANDLPWKKIDLQAKKIPFYLSFHDDLISIGGDFRFANQSTFVKNQTSNTFHTDKSDLYLRINLIPDRLTFYLDESVSPGGAQSREIFGLLRGLPGRGWLKAGEFVLPYGIRLEDDRAFIREATGFNFNSADQGVEIGFAPGDWNFSASLTNGTPGSLDNNTAKLVTGSVYYLNSRFRIGISGAHNPADSGARTSGALWAGMRLGNAVLLGEVDTIRDDTIPGQSREQLITYSELDYLIAPGWNIKAAYEYFDPSRDIDENERDRVLIGIEPVLCSFLQLQIFYRFNQSIPQNKFQNADDLTIRLHIYF